MSGKRRDAGTGQYISEAKAKNMPKNQWVKETDKKPARPPAKPKKK